MTNELEIMRDGKPDDSFKKKVRKIKVAVTYIALVTADYTRWLVIDPWKRLGRELSHQMKLEVLDMLYRTNLHAQYKAGKRTQAILKAKKSYGLVAS